MDILTHTDMHTYNIHTHTHTYTHTHTLTHTNTHTYRMHNTKGLSSHISLRLALDNTYIYTCTLQTAHMHLFLIFRKIIARLSLCMEYSNWLGYT